MYEKPEGLWAFGTWVNGGHWSTCEARMVLGYYRLGRFEDARHSMRALLGFAARFRLDNPLVKFGSEVYQPAQPINLTYDAFGPPAAFVRGVFEYLYRADGLTLIPHVPPGIVRLDQRFPIRLGPKRIFLATAGTGPVTAVTVNGKPWRLFDSHSIRLPASELPDRAAIEIALGHSRSRGFKAPPEDFILPPIPPPDSAWQRVAQPAVKTGEPSDRVDVGNRGGARIPDEVTALLADDARLRRFHRLLGQRGLGDSYEAQHARLAIESAAAAHARFTRLAQGTIRALAHASSQDAADRSYLATARKVSNGLAQVLATYGQSSDPRKQRIARLWERTSSVGR